MCTIAHNMITELIPEPFRFSNSSTEITEHNSQNNSVRDSVIHCSHDLPRLTIPETILFGRHRTGIAEHHSKQIKFGLGNWNYLCAMVLSRKLILSEFCFYACMFLRGGVRGNGLPLDNKNSAMNGTSSMMFCIATSAL